MIHNQVEKVITLIIDSNSEDLKVAVSYKIIILNPFQLFEKAKLLEFIADACADTEYTMGK
jgi:hypothetical protein